MRPAVVRNGIMDNRPQKSLLLGRSGHSLSLPPFPWPEAFLTSFPHSLRPWKRQTWHFLRCPRSDGRFLFPLLVPSVSRQPSRRISPTRRRSLRREAVPPLPMLPVLQSPGRRTDGREASLLPQTATAKFSSLNSPSMII